MRFSCLLLKVSVLLMTLGVGDSMLARSKRELLEERARVAEQMEIVTYKRIENVIPKSLRGQEENESVEEAITVDLRLSILKPEDWRVDDRRAAVLFFHGGGFRSGSPTQFFIQAEMFAKRGAVAFCIEYRLKDAVEVTIAEQLDDARTAIRWVRANATKLGVDPEQVIAVGGSSGGYLAIASAVILEKSQDEIGEEVQLSPVPNAIVAYNPALEFEYYAERSGRERILASVGAPLEDYSCIQNLRAGLPPVFIVQGTADGKTPYKYAQRFVDDSKSLGNVCEIMVFKRLGHGFHNKDPYIKRCFNKALRFLKDNKLKLD